jgi:carnitine-CoA ligase
MKSVRSVFERAVERSPGKPYLWFEGKNITYDEMYREVAKAANGFQELGIKKGDRVSIMLPNLPEFLYIWLGLNSIGASIVPINTFLKEEETAYIVNNSDSKLVVTHERFYHIFQTILPKCQRVQQIVIVGNREMDGNGIFYHELTGNQSIELPQVDLIEDDEASILYTSGTTGRPKGCIEPHSYYLVAGNRYSQQLKLTEKDCVITPLPLFHMNPQILSTMGTLYVGARLALLDRFHPTSWWESVRESGATKFHYLGVMPAMLAGMKPSKQDADHPHWIGMGGGVPQGLHREFEERFNVTLYEAFGMTESGWNSCLDLEEDRKVGTSCIGKVFPEYEAKIVDDHDQEVKPGVVGELVLRGSDPDKRRFGFMREYYKNPEATAEVWKNGWFHTGDYVKADEEGYLYFVDRKKDIIRRSGENVAASEVEDAIRAHPDVLNAAVVPVPDPIREQEIKAYIIPHEGVHLEFEDLIDWCQQKLAYFKIPRYWEFKDRFPITNTGKIQKQQLRAMSEDLRSNSYDRVEKIFRSDSLVKK